MRRPLGVTVIAILVLVLTALAVSGVLSHPGTRAAKRLLPVRAALAILALLAIEALGSLRPRAFLLFTLWSLVGIGYLVTARLPIGSSGHGVRLLGPIAGAGFAYGMAAVYLRRAV